MTAITGYKCDICERFDTERDGWMKLEVHGTRPSPQFQDICSNRCLASLALDRLKDIDGEDYLAQTKRPEVRKRLSPEDKELCVLRAMEADTKVAAEEFGVARSTVQKWLSEANVA